jgi:hypothetical protein
LKNELDSGRKEDNSSAISVLSYAADSMLLVDELPEPDAEETVILERLFKVMELHTSAIFTFYNYCQNRVAWAQRMVCAESLQRLL